MAQSPTKILKTPRLTLRAPAASDLDDLFTIYSNPDAMRYWSCAPYASASAFQAYLDRMLVSAATPPVTYFVLEKDGKAIGTAGHYQENEVGFILHPDFWRQGLVSEAMGAIIPYLWSVLDVEALTADVDPRNDASTGLLKSLGFQVSGTAENTYCIEGVWSHSVYLTLPRPT
ncbi:GNAT family N-acetyltransferase [Flavimaricola marinus]|uniref:Spermidine N(1)-acetyltransferase n=1 Tax=Flavimaricola marinus TaxID=1819565 RepID=A0A238LG67_9RHOB|nr:GNAT family N-acetyltransferase [Flavimaricola marinus]SMY07956.1 Spermidine N(1)-acetyltransferase [Flavimaricola marinus]